MLGQLFDGAALPAPELLDRLPLSRFAARRALRALLPGLMVGLCYFDSRHSATTATLDAGTLRIDGAFADSLDAAAGEARASVAATFRGFGGFLLPGSFQLYPPGSDVHYGGTLAMGRDTTVAGALNGADGVFVCDGSALPSLPAKHPTFTIMANAYRIGRTLADRLASERGTGG